MIPGIPKNPRPSQTKGKTDGSTVIRFLLSYEDYWRLMVMLLMLGLLAGTVAYVYARPTYMSTASVRIHKYLDTTAVAANVKSEAYLNNRDLGDMLTSPYILLEAGKRIGLATEETTYARFQEESVPKVRVDFLGGGLMTITVMAFSPEAVREFSAALIDSYDAAQAKRRREFKEKAVQRYVDELKEMRDRVSNQLDTRLKFEEESALASAQIELERLSHVPVRLVRVKYRLQDMERLQKVLKAQGQSLGTIGQLSLLTSLEPDRKGMTDTLESGRLVRTQGSQSASPVNFQSPGDGKGSYTQVVVQPEMVEGLAPWKDLEKKKRKLEEQERLDSSKYLPDHLQMRKLRADLKEVEGSLELELEVARKAFDLEFARLQDESKELDSKLPAYHVATKDYDEKKLGFSMMQQGQLAWDKAYESLSRELEVMKFGGEDSPVGMDLRGFTEMRDEVPVSPSKSQTAILGFLLGAGMAIGVPFMLRKLDTTVSDLNEFESSLGIMGIGLIPLTDPRLLNEINRSPAVGARVPNALLENFRLIRSSIMLNTSPRGEPRVVMVTSARPSEGKTTTACNVAWAFASQGDRTVVVDCDLRRGQVHTVTDMPNHPGLTDAFTGKATLASCLQKSKADNLWVITRGRVVAGTTEILNTVVFEKMLQELRGQFDRVILDTPPTLGLSETAFLQKHAEGVVFVIRSGKTDRMDVMDAFKSLQKLGAHFYGFVLNRVDFSKRTNAYSYYYYSSNYYDTNWQEPSDEGAVEGMELKT